MCRYGAYLFSVSFMPNITGTTPVSQHSNWLKFLNSYLMRDVQLSIQGVALPAVGYTEDVEDIGKEMPGNHFFCPTQGTFGKSGNALELKVLNTMTDVINNFFLP